jgi:hypothetical protein
MNLIERAKNMIVTPKSEWEVVAVEPSSTAALYKNYIAPLAVIGPVATFIGLSFVGISVPFLGATHVSIATGLSMALVAYVFALIGVFLLALLINVLAPTFGGEKSQIQALKVAAFSYTPAWVAGVLHVLPALGLLVLLAALYSFYVLNLGLPVLMKAPKEKAVGYTFAVVVCAIVIAIILGSVAASVSGFGRWSRNTDVSLSNSDDAMPFTRLKQMSADMHAADKKMAAAKQSGSPQAQADAAGAMMGALMKGGGAQVEPVDQNVLRAMLPDTVASLKRNKLEAEKVGMGAFKVSKAKGVYGDAQGRNVDLTITDAGGAAIFGALAAWALVEQEKETDNGYEKTGKVDGRPVQEKFDKAGMDGEYDVVVASRFIVGARGRQVDMSTLKQAVAAVGLDKLEALKMAGVKQ